MGYYHRRDCKACGERNIQHSLLDLPEGDTWRCENCGARTLKQMQKKHTRQPGLTLAQQKAIDEIRERLVREHYGDRYADQHEIKRFEVTDHDYFASLVATTGCKGDEGTMAEVFCRRTVHVAIGRCGGLELMNPSAKATYKRGWFAVMHSPTAY